MNTMNIIVAGVCFLFAVCSLIYVVFTVQKKGPILSNVYLAASKEQKKSMNTDKLYKECRNIFSFIFMICLNIGTFILSENSIFLYGAYLFILGVNIYVIAISVRSLKNETK